MKFKFLIFLSLCSITFLQAQEVEEEVENVDEYFEEGEIIEEELADKTPMFSLGIEFDLGIPLNTFNENVDGIAFGFGGSFLVRTNPKSSVPVLAGISGRYNNYDRESQNQLIIVDGGTVDGRIITRNSIFMGHGILRILPPVNFPIQPYFDGLFGIKNLFTKTSLEESLEFGESEVIESYIEQGDWALSYGGALGAQILITGQDNFYMLFDLRCAYLRGDAADYLVRIDDPNIQIVDTIDAFEEKNSSTDMLIPQIGFSFVF